MITDDIINKTFIERIASRDAKIIRETQRQVISTYDNGGTGQLAVIY